MTGHSDPDYEAAARAARAAHRRSTWAGRLSTLAQQDEVWPPVPAPVRHLTDDFALTDAHLRDTESGQWDAARIASVLGIPLTTLAPEGANTPEHLASLGSALAVVSAIFDGDLDDVRAWLRVPQPFLHGDTPLVALCDPQRVRRVEEWVTGLWLGEPE